MRIDGKTIAENVIFTLESQVKALSHAPHLAIVYVGDNPVIENFIGIKKRTAEKIGATVQVFRYPHTIETHNLIKEIEKIASETSIDGVVVQLPIPKTIETQSVLNAVPKEKDIDVLSESGFASFKKGQSVFMPAVVGAINEIFKQHSLFILDKKIVVLGEGRLVGGPIISWLKQKKCDPIVLTSSSENKGEVLKSADIIISGIGVPGLIKPDMVKPGAVIIDAGTSEEGGRVVGDTDPLCEERASLFTPVPGGVGPITVAILFKNLVLAAK